MQKIYRFNMKDIKQLLADKYHITDLNKINFNVWNDSGEGFDYVPSGCNFEIEIEDNYEEE